MKNIKYITCLSLLSLASLMGCKEDKLSDDSVFQKKEEPKTAFDNWLYNNYITPFNCDFKYRMDYNESDHNYYLIPAQLEKSMLLAKIVKYAWIDAYVEVAGVNFMKKCAPAILHVIGSAAWHDDGTRTLGVAEGGLKISLYETDSVDPRNVENLNSLIFETMHHEFTHILQQHHMYPMEYNKISAPDYRPSGWANRSIDEYAPLGFITAYAGSSDVEDITELTACYITFSQEKWDRVFRKAGKEGRAKLNQKFAIMKQYMKDTWGIDIHQLREVVHRRMLEVVKLEEVKRLIDEDWKPLIEGSTTAIAESAFKENLLNLIENDPTKANTLLTKKNGECLINYANLINDNN